MNTNASLDINQVLDLLAVGNPYIWALLFLSLTVLFMVAWIKFEKQIRSFFLFVGSKFSKKARAELIEKKKEAHAIEERKDLFFEKISILTSRIRDLKIASNPGRNAFYQYYMYHFFSLFYQSFQDLYTRLNNKELTEEEFSSYSKVHLQEYEKVRFKIRDNLRQKLTQEGWDLDTIRYVENSYKSWKRSHFQFLEELISQSKNPGEVIFSWWVFLYECYIFIEKFGIHINGIITGKPFEGYIIGDPDHG